MTTSSIMSAEDTALVQEALDAYCRFARSLHCAALPAWLQLDLSIGQLKGLLVVANQGAVTIGGLAECMGISRPAASHLVDQLHQRSLVTRTEDPVDRRRSWVRLTTGGRELIEQLYSDERHTLSGWVGRLQPADLVALAAGLRALATLAADETAPEGRHAWRRAVLDVKRAGGDRPLNLAHLL